VQVASETGKSAEVAPIGAGGITPEAALHALRGMGAKGAIEQYLSVV
jgi:hypothetical protein